VVRVIIVAFTLSLASSVQAMPVSPVQAPDSNMVVTARAGCGVGYQPVAGRCVRNTAVRSFRRSFRRCERRLRHNGQCIRWSARR
jgi:hypothetical protein